nr:class I SAM-dependent methyltransferase [Candidatus Dependentiae bacterium]
MKNSTLDYYNLNAESYFELTSSIELSSTYDSVEKYFVEKTGVLIDLGSGSGRDSNQLILRKYNVISVDLSEKLLKISKKKFDLEKVCLADFMKLPFKNRAVKYIFASASLLHIPKK